MTEYLPDKPFFRPDEVAKYFSVSKSTVYRWIDEGRLQSVKVAGYGAGLAIAGKKETSATY